MMNWLRHNPVATGLLTMLRIWLGAQWTLSGYEKLTADAPFSPAGLIQNAIENPVEAPHGEAYPWYTDFLRWATDNGQNADIFGPLVAWGELLVGLGLLFGTLTLLAAFFGAMMNVAFLLAGSISVNPLFLLVSFVILAAGFNAAKIGLDYWLTPFFRQKIKRA